MSVRKEPMKTKIRLQFGNDMAAEEVAAFATYLHKSCLFKSVCLEDDGYRETPGHEDLVEIELDGAELKAQFTWLIAGLTKWLGWEFVGPECPRKRKVVHTQATRNLVSMKLPRFGREKWSCMDNLCRRSEKSMVEIDRNDDVMNYREFTMMSHLVMGDPGPVTKFAIDTETNGFNPDSKYRPYGLRSLANQFLGKDVASQQHWREQYMKIDYSQPNHVGQIPRDTDVNKISKTLLNADFESVEWATLFYQLGLQDPRLLHISRAESLQYAAGWVDGGGVLLVNSDTNPDAIRSVFDKWARENHPADGVQLAIFEVDEQNLSQEILAKLKEAAGRFATVSDNRMRVARQMAKTPKFSDVPTSGKVLQVHDEVISDHMVKDILKMFPSIGDGYRDQALRQAHDQIAMLSAKVASLEDEVSNCDETKKFMHAEKKKLENELELWDKAVLLPKSVGPAMDNMLRFLASLNMQDHSIQEQRDFNFRFKQLKDAYEEVRDQMDEKEEKANT